MKFTAVEKENSSPRQFLRLKDKESIIGIFQGEILEFHQIWENGKSRIVPDTDANGVFRFRLNIIIKENGTLVSKIFEQGYVVYCQLKELHEEYNLEQIYVKITRNGSGPQTTYSIMPMLKQKPDAKQLSNVQLQELGLGKKAQTEPAKMPIPTADDFVDFDEEADKIPF